MNAALVATLVRLGDSAFPSGSFSHSFGLESAVAAGRVRDEASLAAWLDAYLRDAWATLDGAAFVLSSRDRVASRVLDETVTAATHAPEIRRANARIAAAIFDTLSAMGVTGARLTAYRDDVRDARASGVPTLVFALAYDALGVDWRAAFVACASATLTGLAAAATRSVPLGQRSTARVLWTLRDAVTAALAVAERAERPEDLAAQAFEAEIDALVHRSLDGRLFAS